MDPEGQRLWMTVSERATVSPHHCGGQDDENGDSQDGEARPHPLLRSKPMPFPEAAVVRVKISSCPMPR